MPAPPVIEVDHLCKQFRIGRNLSLRQTVASGLARLRNPSATDRTRFSALTDVTFSVAPGEVLGIIGHNGAGKSTLLKMLARISEPSSGRIRVSGRIAPLIEVGAGLVGELTGRENIFLNGTILGMKRADIARKLDEIVAFAELEQFIDTPLKRYSSGMQVRLGFAIATAVDAEVLIVDEVLAVGDIAFQRKCYDRMLDLIYRQERTILFVSHNVKEIERLSDRVLLLDHGRVAAIGDPQTVCNEYFEQTHRKILEQGGTEDRHSTHVQSSGEVVLQKIELLDEDGCVADSAVYGRPCFFRIGLRVTQPIERPEIEFGIHTLEALRLATCTSMPSLSLPRLDPGEHSILCGLQRMPFLPGVYGVRLHIGVGEANHGVFYGEHLLRFTVAGADHRLDPVVRQGFVEIAADWALDPVPIESAHGLRRHSSGADGGIRRQPRPV